MIGTPRANPALLQRNDLPTQDISHTRNKCLVSLNYALFRAYPSWWTRHCCFALSDSLLPIASEKRRSGELRTPLRQAPVTNSGLEMCSYDKRESWCLLVQDNAKEGRIDVETAVVLNETQLPEFVHEKVDSGARCADHLRQSLLRYFGDHFLRFGVLAIASEQKKSAGQPFFARIEKLIDQIRFESDVP